MSRVSAAPEKAKKPGKLRLLVRCSALAAAVILAAGVLPWAWTPMVLPSLSPYVLIGSAVAARSVSLATLVGLPVLLIVLVRRRWFCRYACPLGLVAEQVGRLRRSGQSRARKLPAVGKWIAMLTLGGACFGYPLLLWLDPLAIFHGVFTLWHEPPSPAGQASAVALAVILSISLLLPGAWCLRICPLGATQDLLALAQRPLRRKGEKSLFGAKNRAVPQGRPRERDLSSFLARRSLFSVAFGAVFAGLGAWWAVAASNRSLRNRSTLLRPPGSADEKRFTGLCIRCGNCIRACPAGIIEPDPGTHGIVGFLTPVIRFQDDYCREDCRRCTQVCPSGAIVRLSLPEKKQASIGLAKVDVSLCLLTDDWECRVCVRACPYQAIKIVWSEEEYVATVHVDPEKCPGCGACEVVCPGTNEWQRQQTNKPTPLRKAIEVCPSRSC